MQQLDRNRAEDPVWDVMRAAGHDDGRPGAPGGVVHAGRVQDRVDRGFLTALERVRHIAAQLLGLALCRYILRFEPLASLPAAEVAASVAPSVQHYLS